MKACATTAAKAPDVPCAACRSWFLAFLDEMVATARRVASKRGSEDRRRDAAYWADLAEHVAKERRRLGKEWGK